MDAQEYLSRQAKHEPQWLSAVRQQAWQAAEAARLQPRSESWKRSSPEDFDLLKATSASAGSTLNLENWAELSAEHHVLAITPSGVQSLGVPLPAGVTLTTGTEAAAALQAQAGGHAPKHFASERLSAMHQALTQYFIFLTVDADIVVQRPLLLLQALATAEPTVVSSGISLGRGASLVVAEDWLQVGGHLQVLNSVQLAANARLNQLLWAGGPAQGSSLWQHHVSLAEASDYYGTLIFSGARRTRLVTQTELNGKGASSKLRGIVAGSGRQFFDIEPIQEHNAPHTISDMLFKTVVADRSRAVFQGDIKVARIAKGTESRQTNKNLLLGKDARVDSLPKLWILPDEVSCRHGSATGSVDPEQIYYLTSRGFTPEAAAQIVVLGFFSDITAELPADSGLRAFYDERLRAVALAQSSKL